MVIKLPLIDIDGKQTTINGYLMANPALQIFPGHEKQDALLYIGDIRNMHIQVLRCLEESQSQKVDSNSIKHSYLIGS